MTAKAMVEPLNTKALEATILAVIDATEVRYGMRLVRLVDGQSTYELKIDGQPALLFTDNVDGEATDQLYAYVAQRKREERIKAVQAILAAPELASRSLDLLAELGKHPGWSLETGHRDFSDEDSDYGWCVLEEFGGRSDRDWRLVGFGPTPTEALLAALSQGEKP